MSKLSIIVPVFNEEKELAEVIDRLMRWKCPVPCEWIFIDDCSKDRSLEILKAKSRQYGFRVIAQETNQGKGAAVALGIKEATGEWLIIQDADFEYDPNDINLLLEPMIQQKADVVFGSRFKKSAFQVHRTYHYFVNRFLTILSNLFSGIYLTDMETCYKVFRSDLIKAMRLQSMRFGFEVEVTAYIAKIRCRVFELPISYYPRTVLQGKKISWKDGFAALYHLFRFNWWTPLEKAFDLKRLPERYVSFSSVARPNESPSAASIHSPNPHVKSSMDQ